MNYSNDNLTGFSLVQDLSKRTDREIISLFKARFGENLPGWALIALGGYARKDLCPYSDLDILLLVENKTARSEIENAIGEILYPLWDKGFNASYSVRTIKETVHDAKKDFFFRTSLIDARFICGSDLPFKKLLHALKKNRALKKPKKFVSDLLFHTHKRHTKFGDASYILEPDLKEGHGGLRDYQGVMWAINVLSHNKVNVSGLMNHMNMKELGEAYDFIVKIRFILHELSGRKNDRMHLEHQEILAEKLSFQGSEVETSAEAFMKHFHRKALAIRSNSDAFLFSLAYALGLTKSPPNRVIDEHFHVPAGQLAFTAPGEVRANPHLIMSAFGHLAEGDYTLSPSARSLIINSLHLACDLRRSSRAQETFLKILSSDKARRCLTCMLEMGILDHFIPEFETIKGRTIFDMYHTYTVDLHSINTVAELKALENAEPEIFSRVRDKDALYLSAFLHDIGKGYGKKHETVGARIAVPIADRLGLKGESIDLVGFLIQNHIVLADLATKRDLSEERVVIEFAQRMRDPQRLSMLYLLTVADSKATGPLGWNDWKEALINELYSKALHIMEKGIFKDPADTARFEKKWQRLIDDIPKEQGSEQAGPLWALPQAYILYSETADIKRHMSLRNQLHTPDDIKMDVTQEKNHVTLTIITRDRPGLFSTLTGILALNHLEIISAKVFTWLDGNAVDVFKVITPWHDYQKWDRIADQFRSATSGEMDISSKLLTTKGLKNNDQTIINPLQRSSVLIDNDTSDFFTLIEIHAQNRLGMLYRVAHIITGFGLDIHRAFVSRNEDLCSDVFYVVDAVGEKIEDKLLKDRITEDIHKVLAVH